MHRVIDNHDQIVKIWIEKSPKPLTIPPPCFMHMQGQLIHWNSQQKLLIAHFPLKVQFQNPRQYMQGGFAVAAIDNTLGPLSYLSDAPSVTTQLNTSYIRPIAPHYHYIEVTATITDRTLSKIHSSAQVTSPNGKLLITTQATSHIVMP